MRNQRVEKWIELVFPIEQRIRYSYLKRIGFPNFRPGNLRFDIDSGIIRRPSDYEFPGKRSLAIFRYCWGTECRISSRLSNQTIGIEVYRKFRAIYWSSSYGPSYRSENPSSVGILRSNIGTGNDFVGTSSRTAADTGNVIIYHIPTPIEIAGKFHPIGISYIFYDFQSFPSYVYRFDAILCRSCESDSLESYLIGSNNSYGHYENYHHYFNNWVSTVVQKYFYKVGTSAGHSFGIRDLNQFRCPWKYLEWFRLLAFRVMVVQRELPFPLRYRSCSCRG